MGRTSVKRTEYSRATTVALHVYTQVYPITLPIFGKGQMSKRNARCLPIDTGYCIQTDTHEFITWTVEL